MTCDLAETYHIYNWRALPIRTVAVLAYGLRDDSRIKMRMLDTDVKLETQLQALTLDTLQALAHALTRSDSKPKSVYGALMGLSDKGSSEAASFDSIEDFESARRSFFS